MIIGLAGRARAGKDSVAQMLIHDFANVRRVGFADKLKDSAAAALGISRDQLEQVKLHGSIEISPDAGFPAKVISGRQYLQYYGTEAHRNIFGDHFWIEEALDKTLVQDGDILVVTDMRFPNELNAVLERGGVAVKVRRPEADAVIDGHASEQILPDEQFDYFLDNDGSLVTLRSKVLDMVLWIRSNRPQYRFNARDYHNYLVEDLV